MQSQCLSWAKPPLWSSIFQASLFGRFWQLGKLLLMLSPRAQLLLSEHHWPGFPQCSLWRRRSLSFGSQQHKNNTQFLQYQPVLYFSETRHLHQHRICLLSLETWLSFSYLDMQLSFLQYWDVQTCCTLHFMGSLFTHVLSQEKSSVSERVHKLHVVQSSYY